MGFPLFSSHLRRQFQQAALLVVEEIRTWISGFWYGDPAKIDEQVQISLLVLCCFGAFSDGGSSQTTAGKGSVVGRWGWYSEILGFVVSFGVYGCFRIVIEFYASFRVTIVNFTVENVNLIC